jgi:hypothetical protein
MQAGNAGSAQRSALRSWKEIAAYLDVGVRTAQLWERDRGLPVHRVPGSNGRVMASAEELDQWLQSARTAQTTATTVETGGQPPSTTTVEPIAPPRRVLWWIGAAALAAALAIGIGAWLGLRRPPQPATWKMQNGVFSVFAEDGGVLWRVRIEGGAADYLAPGDWGQQNAWIGDLDGDGSNEVLLAYQAVRAPDKSALICYSAAGAERWRFIPGQPASRKFPETSPPPYMAHSVVAAQIGGKMRVLIASVHPSEVACQVAMLTNKGRLLKDYWHAGHLARLAVADAMGNGREMVLAAGVANGYNRAVLVALDPDAEWGVSTEVVPRYRIPGRMGTEIARVLFPSSCISRLWLYNSVRDLRIASQSVDIITEEQPNVPAPRGGAGVQHRFSRGLHYMGASLVDDFPARHQQLERQGELDHPFSESEREGLGKIEWLSGPPLERPGH